MSLPLSIANSVEHRRCSIYTQMSIPDNPTYLRNLFDDEELPLSMKFTVALALFSRFTFPLKLSKFRSLIPNVFWETNCYFSFTSLLAGSVPIYWSQDQWFYSLCLGRGRDRTRYGSQMVYFVASAKLMPRDGRPEGIFEPPLDAEVFRYTLHHPLFQPELHDPKGIFLFRNF